MGIAELALFKIDNRTKELNELYLISGVSLVSTLICAAVGLRRRKAAGG